jgi:hypothetical protein
MNKKLRIELFLYLFLNVIARRIEAFHYFDESYDYYENPLRFNKHETQYFGSFGGFGSGCVDASERCEKPNRIDECCPPYICYIYEGDSRGYCVDDLVAHLINFRISKTPKNDKKSKQKFNKSKS